MKSLRLIAIMIFLTWSVLSLAEEGDVGAAKTEYAEERVDYTVVRGDAEVDERKDIESKAMRMFYCYPMKEIEEADRKGEIFGSVSI